MAKKQIFIITACGGHYKDKWEKLIGAYSTYDSALKVAKDTVDEYKPIESELPMAFDEYERCNYGYRDIPVEGYDFYDTEQKKYYSEIIERDGHSVDDFKKMQHAELSKIKDFTFCTIVSIVVDEPINRFGNTACTYVSRGCDGERYHFL